LRLAAGVGAALFGHQFAVAQPRDQGGAMQTRPIPSSGEALPVIGCGTYVGFDVGADTEKLKTLADVVRTLRAAGGKVFDSSPMYGRAEAVLGDLLASCACCVLSYEVILLPKLQAAATQFRGLERGWRLVAAIV
jgi:diketogulonate reductase-like aldo/keto reductase